MIAMSGRGLYCAPMISFFLIVEMTNASDVRSVSVLLRPVDGVSLYFECLEYVVSVIFDHIIVNVASFGAALPVGPPHKLSPCSHLLTWSTQPFMTPLNVILHDGPIFANDVFISLSVDRLADPFR
jgi:hypothetical protein